MIKKLYPNGKEKAFNLTYDDGIYDDYKFVELLNKYNLKGTFNLNSKLMKENFSWTHETGKIIKRISPQEAVCLYKGHEVASHTLTHPYMNNLTKKEILKELIDDKKNLEEIFKKQILGFAVPFDFYSKEISECVKETGFEYGRISEESNSWIPSEDYYFWKASIIHFNLNLENFVNEFIKTNDELALCQIVGHSYDLEVENKWNLIENIFKKISESKNILPMTNIEIIKYLKAIRSVKISENKIINNSDLELWFEVDGKKISVQPKKEFFIKWDNV